MNRTVSLLLALVASMVAQAQGYDRMTGKPFASRSEVIAANGMAATSQPLATQVAPDILKKAPDKGDIFRNPRLADTYEQIAAGGRILIG